MWGLRCFNNLYVVVAQRTDADRRDLLTFLNDDLAAQLDWTDALTYAATVTPALRYRSGTARRTRRRRAAGRGQRRRGRRERVVGSRERERGCTWRRDCAQPQGGVAPQARPARLRRGSPQLSCDVRPRRLAHAPRAQVHVGRGTRRPSRARAATIPTAAAAMVGRGPLRRPALGPVPFPTTCERAWWHAIGARPPARLVRA